MPPGYHVRFRWVRWAAAMCAVIGSAVALRRLAQHVGPEGDATWVVLLRGDLDRVASGDLPADVIVRWAVVAMALALGWIALSLLVVIASYRRSIPFPRGVGRWATIFVCGGSLVTSSLAVSPVSASPVVEITEQSDTGEPKQVVIGASSDLQLVGTAVVSALLGAGVALRLRARDHERRRQASIGDAPPVGLADSSIPDELGVELSRAEKTFASIVDVVRRIRCLAPDHEIRHVIDERNGWYVVEFTRPVKAIPSTEMVTGRSVRLRPDSTPPIDVDESRLPMLMHVGRAMSGEVWVSLDAYGEFGVECGSDEGERVWKNLVDSVVMAPMSRDRGLVSDADIESAGPQRVFRVSDGTPVAEGAHRLGESIAVIHADDTPCGVPALRRVTSGTVMSGLSCSGGEWRLVPIDIAIQPVGAGSDDIRRIRDVLGDPLPVIEISEMTPDGGADGNMNSDDGWTFMASVLGPPQVVDRRFEIVEFERGKAEELVIWLAFHPEQRKRSLARTALWLSPVQDATFSNITASARRSLNAVVVPPEGQTWVGITLSDDLPLADGFVTDVERLREAVDRARRCPEDRGLERLRDALQLVRGVPFAGSTYTWSDGIGMSGDAATLVVRAASMMAEMCQEIGDMGGVYWATAKGLLALPGHEELVSIRLRAHAERGDRIAMRAEWESYRRAVACEWGDAEPSEKMMELWHRLGTSRSAEDREQPAHGT